MEAAEGELELARLQLERCVVRAPSAGVVMLPPVHVGGEYRPARVGDTLIRNQPFMALPDVGDWVGVFLVPELELGLMREGGEVWLVPLAYAVGGLGGRGGGVGTGGREGLGGGGGVGGEGARGGAGGGGGGTGISGWWRGWKWRREWRSGCVRG